VGLGAVVTHDVPPNMVAAGIPPGSSGSGAPAAAAARKLEHHLVVFDF
jgi:serine acetyltransferase